MRSIKSSGGLTRGSGISEHQRALWTMSSHVLANSNDAIQGFTRHTFTTSEQHKEAKASKMNRDHVALKKVVGKLQPFLLSLMKQLEVK